MTRLKGVDVRVVAAVVAAFSLGGCLAVGCGSSEETNAPADPSVPIDDTAPVDTETEPGPLRDAAAVPGDDDDGEEVPDGGDADGGLDAESDAAIPGDGGECAARANGFPVEAGSVGSRCCFQQLVPLNSTDNCGGCGIQCPTGMACEQPVPGQWGCRCTTNDSCRSDGGYGAAATCFTVDAKAFCNCQCPAGEANCKGVCGGGSTCNDVTGQNYCSYP